MSDGVDIALRIIAKADRIEQEANGRALLPDEIQTVKAAAFLRKIWPNTTEGKQV